MIAYIMFVIKFFAGSHSLARTCAEGSARNSKARKLHQIRRDGESIFIFFVLSNVIIIYFYCGPFYIIYLYIYSFIGLFVYLSGIISPPTFSLHLIRTTKVRSRQMESAFSLLRSVITWWKKQRAGCCRLHTRVTLFADYLFCYSWKAFPRSFAFRFSAIRFISKKSNRISDGFAPMMLKVFIIVIIIIIIIRHHYYNYY